MGAVWLSRAALPHFKHMRRGKIIQLSGGGATQPTPMLSAYAASKAAVVRFIETLAHETRAWHIDAAVEGRRTGAVPRFGAQRWHHGPADQRYLGSLG